MTSCEPDEDWPEPPPTGWEVAETPLTTGPCELVHVVIVDVTPKAFAAAESKRRRERAWDRTGYGFRP